MIMKEFNKEERLSEMRDLGIEIKKALKEVNINSTISTANENTILYTNYSTVILDSGGFPTIEVLKVLDSINNSIQFSVNFNFSYIEALQGKAPFTVEQFQTIVDKIDNLKHKYLSGSTTTVGNGDYYCDFTYLKNKL